MRTTKEISTIILLVLAIILLWGVHFRHDPDNTDLWIHLSEGKLIYENKALPKYDVFTYTRLGTEASMHEWLYQVVLYMLYTKIGLTGLLIVNTALILLLLMLIFNYLKESFYFALIATIAMSYLLLISSTIRPQIVSFIFLLVVFLLIKQDKEWFLPLIFLVWGNIHPLHLLGLTITAIYLFKKYYASKERKYVFIGILSILAAAINPMGIKTFLIPFAITYPHIYEWSPLLPSGNYFWIYTGMVLFGIYSFFRGKTFSKDFEWDNFFVFLLLVYLGYNARRHVAQFFIIGGMILLHNFKDIGGKEIFRMQTTTKDVLCMIGIITLMITSIKGGNGFHPAFNWDMLPQKEGEMIKTYNIQGNVFNDYGYGGFLEFFLYPHDLVYIDSRVETMGQELLDEYYSLGTKRKFDIFEVLDRDNVTIVIVRHAMGITNILLNNPNWKLIYLDGTRASFVRRTNETEIMPEEDISKNKYVN